MKIWRQGSDVNFTPLTVLGKPVFTGDSLIQVMIEKSHVNVPILTSSVLKL